MPRHVTISDHQQEQRLFRARILAALVFVSVLVAILVARLLWLQVLQHDHYITASEDNRLKVQAAPPSRGLIYDRNGVLLAENQPSYQLEVTPEQVEDMDATLKALGEVVELRPADLKRFRRLLRRRRAFEGIPLRFRLNDDEVARFAVNRHRFPGVDIQARLSRHYPLGKDTVHLVGYVGRINERELQKLDPAAYSGTTHIGKVGIEKTYEEELHGHVGHRRVEINAQGRVLRVVDQTPPRQGHNLYLSVDIRVQQAAIEALGDQTGAVVAIDPRNGEVLALVSTPVYDPNPFVNGIEAGPYRALRDDPERPLFNRALRGQYPPGSTYKPFIAMAGIDGGFIAPDYKVPCNGYFTLPGDDHRYRDWKKQGHGPTDMHKAVVQSCDVYFYQLAHRMGIDAIHDFLSQLGLGRRTGIDIVGELGGLLPSRSWKRRAKGLTWFPGETVIAGIGQGYNLATPLQLAHATAIVAARGKGFRPHVLYATEDPTSGEINVFEPQPLKPVTVHSETNWERIHAAMADVVHGLHGTARRIGLDSPYRIAGKTGTAQVFGVKQDEKYEAHKLTRKLHDHALFIAFAPVEDPRIAVAVVVEHGGHGGSSAAPVARKVMDAYLLGDSR
jgi:penicillin-binding protein 2